MRSIRFYLVLMVMCVSSTMFAQEADEINPRFEATSNEAVVDVNSSCNKGAEPFWEFIISFVNDEDFRASRIALTPNDLGDFVAMEAEDVPENETFEFFEESWLLVEEEGAPSFTCLSASWFDVAANKVCYARGEACEDLTIDATNIYIFTRVNGKWHLTNYLELPDEDEEEFPPAE